MDTFLRPVSISEQSSTPSTPSSGYQKVYPKTDGFMYALNSSGTETQITNVIPTGFVKTDGTTPLTANWLAGAYSITANSVILGSAANTIAGGAVSAGNLTLFSTTNATKGKILFGNSTYDEANNRLGIGTTSPQAPLHLIRGTAGPFTAVTDEVIVAQRNTNTNDVSIISIISGATSGISQLRLGNGSGAATPYLSSISYRNGTNILTFEMANVEKIRLTAAGLFSIGGIAPTALLHIKAGTATANTAPFKFTVSGTALLTTPEAGVLEPDSANKLYYTGASAVRNTIAYTESVGANIITSLTGINAKTVANTLAYTNSTGKNTIVTQVVVRCTAATAITNGPTVGIGTASGTNDIFAATAINALTTTSNIFGFVTVGMSVLVPNGGTIYLNLTATATGTSQTIAADFIGYNV